MKVGVLAGDLKGYLTSVLLRALEQGPIEERMAKMDGLRI